MVARALLNNNNNNKFPLNKLWSATQFNLVNPTQSNYIIDLFNAYTLTNVRTTPMVLLTPNAITATINIGVGSSDCITYNSLDNTMYVSNFNNNRIEVIDCVTNTITSTIIFTGSPSFSAFNNATNTIYVTDYSGLNLGVFVIDCNTNTLTTTIPIIGTTQLAGIVHSPINNIMYVSDNITNTVYAIDCTTNTVISSIPVGLFPNRMAYNSLNNTIYVSNLSSSTISVIDCNTNSVISTFGIISPVNIMEYNTLSNSMYCTDSINNKVYVLNCNTNIVIFTISLGLAPYGITYDSLNNTMYVGNASVNSVNVIDCTTNIIIYTISVGSFGSNPQELAYNSFNNTIYVSDAADSQVSVMSSPTMPTFYISGSTDYNQFVREFSFMPKRVRHITMIVDNPSQLNIPYELLTRDANGISVNNPKLPNNSVKVNQYQSNMVELSFGEKELILDNTTTFNQYTVLANSEVKMVIYYDEIDLSDALTNSVSVCQMIEPTVADGSSKTEAELEAKENLPLLDLKAIKSLRASDFIK